MRLKGGLMQLLHELEDFPVGVAVLTPSGRRAIVIKHLSGASKRDYFTRIVCRFEDGDSKDLVTLQPYQLRRAGPRSVDQWMQAALAFAFPRIKPRPQPERRRYLRMPDPRAASAVQLWFPFD
jgi:hypothetical protein